MKPSTVHTAGAIDGSKDTKKRKKAQGNNHIDKKHLCLLSGARNALVKSLNPKAGTVRVTTRWFLFCFRVAHFVRVTQ